MKPLARIPFEQKMANPGKEGSWSRKTMDYYINMCSFRLGNTSKRDLKQLYDVYNNKFPASWFNYVSNPLGTDRKEHMGFPARIREYPLLRPNIDLLRGEYGKRAFNWQVVAEGEKAYNSYLDGLYKQVTDSLTQLAINQIAEKMPTDTPAKPVDPPEKIKQTYGSNYLDQTAISMQKGLKLLMKQKKVKLKLKKMLTDWLIAGEVYSYKGIRRNSIDYSRISPLHVDYDKSSDQDLCEDGEWFAARYRMTLSEVIDSFYEELTDEMHEALDKNDSAHSYLFALYKEQQDNPDNSYDKIEVIHLCWKTPMKIGILSYVDPLTGEMQQMEVDESFKPRREQGETVKWMWVNQVMEGYQLMGKYYLGIRVVPAQRSELNSLSACKLPYNGKRYSDLHSENISILELGIPFLVMYIILNYRLELTIAKSKGKIALIDNNVIPKKKGWDEEKFFYYAESLGFAMIDRSQPGVDKSYNQYQVLDMDLFKHIEQLISSIAYYEQKWDDTLGITRQRKGQMQASDAVGNTQSSLFQSSVITEEIFAGFEDFVESELQGLLDCLKLAWIGGKEALYHNDDMRASLLSVQPEDLSSCDLGIFVTNASKENEQLQQLRGAAQQFAQNGAKPSTLAKIISSSNIAEITAELDKIEQAEIALTQQNALSLEQQKQEAERIKQEYEQLRHAFDLEKINVEADRLDQREYIKGEIELSKLGATDNDGNGRADMIDEAKNQNERLKIQTDTVLRAKEAALTEKKLQLEERKITTDMQTKKYVADRQVEAAKHQAKAPAKK